MRASSSEASGSSISSSRGLREQRPADRDALLLAARQLGRAGASSRCADAEQLDDLVELAVAARSSAREPAAVEQVLAHGQVREQPPFLEDVADAAPVLRHEDAALGVGQHVAVDDDAALLGPDQPGDDVDQRGLAGAGAAEQRGQPALGSRTRRRARSRRAGAGPRPRASCQLQVQRAPVGAPAASEASSAAIEIAIETSVRRNAPASPPGTWVKV